MEGQTSPPSPHATAASISVAVAVRLFPVTDPFSTALMPQPCRGYRLTAGGAAGLSRGLSGWAPPPLTPLLSPAEGHLINR